MLRGGTADALQVNGYTPFELFGIAFAVLSVPFVLIGLYIVYSGLRKGRASSRRDEFEPVRARVLASDLDEHRHSGGGAGPGTGTTTTRYVPDIEYEYTVDGRTYTSDSVWPGEDLSGTNEEQRQAVVDRYPEGEVVEAYYDPANPSKAFLENESRGTAAIVLVVFGVVFTLGGLAAAGFGLLFVL